MNQQLFLNTLNQKNIIKTIKVIRIRPQKGADQKMWLYSPNFAPYSFTDSRKNLKSLNLK
ncbi:hypothetical protein PCC7424_0830 [Gloeothece citriformis PCC 7424]|uniref:Uncharacterized protein n=1 Tax=Gloeothece citriformis (strain PCC 7424) TaxID=65393 RepID=B7KH77_GLOC7|nr:hypothetical protein [Gloeothece citriformis]ACK69286.1 hypothetical protein PCC7424_0830 [Gloeothece citriformis PCC 7424]